VSDQTSTLLIRLLSTGDLTALVRAKDQSEATRVSVDGLKRALEGLGVGLTFGAALEGIRRTTEYASSIQDLSEQANINVEAFQKLTYTASDAGVRQEELAGALAVLNRNMAEAANGSSKQNRAIADLGLNTAELLAMPVEDQISAIARAYEAAADKGKAWADVVDLLGKNSSKLRGVLADLAAGKSGAGIIVSQADVENAAKFDDALDRAGITAKSLWMQALDHPGDFVGSILKGGPTGMGLLDFQIHREIERAQAQPKPETEAEKQARIATIKAQLEATIQALPQMVTAHRALEKALQDERKAYEAPAEAARRLREEAKSDMEQADKLSADKYNAEAQLEAVKLRTEAAKLRAQANAEDSKSIREQDKYIAEQIELNAKFAQLSAGKLTVGEQITKAHEHETAIFKQLESLDKNSLTYRQDKLKLENQLLAVKREIAALDEKSAMQQIEQDMRDADDRRKRSAIALAAVEHDYSKTDAEKWELRRQLISRTIADQERYVANMRAMASAGGIPQDARDRARDAAQTGAAALDGSREQLAGMGPNPHSFTQNFAADLTGLQNQWGTLEQQMSRGFTGTISAGINSATNNLTRLVTGMQGLGATVRGIAVDIGVTLIQSFINMGVKWVANRIMMAAFDKTIAAASVAALVPLAMAQSALWATPATLATIASFGGAAAQAPVSMSAAVAAGHAISMFEEGGFTGGREGMPAGIVHGEEFVWSAPAVRAIGAGNLERAHRAALGGGGRYSGGGIPGGGDGEIKVINVWNPHDQARAMRDHIDARVLRAGRNINGPRVNRVAL